MTPHISKPLAALLRALGSLLEEQGVEGHVVGGFWRDILAGRAVHDVDVAVAADTLALGRELARRLDASLVVLDSDRGIVRLALRERPVDFVDLTPLRGDILQDLAYRDFTIDAMAAPLTANGVGPFIDPYGGRHDLEQGLLRAVGEEVFREDGLRLLRALRLCAELGLNPEPATAGLIRRDAQLLARVAPERQRAELCRLLATPRAGEALALMDELGLLAVFLPEVAAGRGVEQPREGPQALRLRSGQAREGRAEKGHYYDVLGHSVAAVAALDFMLLEQAPGEPRQADLWRILWQYLKLFPQIRQTLRERIDGYPRLALLKLAALLHDIAKPETKTMDEKGRVRFLGHAKLGAERAGAIMARLRFGNAATRLVKLLVAHHLRPGLLAQAFAVSRDSGVRPPTRRALYRLFRDLGEPRWAPHAYEPTKASHEVGAGHALPLLLLLHLADHAATLGPHLDIPGWEAHAAYAAWLLAQAREEQARVEPRLVTGHDVMAALHMRPGPLVGRILQAVQEAQATGEIDSREEALALAGRLAEGHGQVAEGASA